jgi:hypothetical protein
MMQTTRRTFLGVGASCLIGPALGASARADAGYVLVPVVAAMSPTYDIALGTLRRIFLSEVVEDSARQRFIAFNHPPLTRPRTLFDQVVLNMTPDEMAHYWVDQRIRSGLRPPRAVTSVALLRQVIALMPGAIGYLTPADLDATVRAISVDGKGPDAPRYPLR